MPDSNLQDRITIDDALEHSWIQERWVKRVERKTTELLDAMNSSNIVGNRIHIKPILIILVVLDSY